MPENWIEIGQIKSGDAALDTRLTAVENEVMSAKSVVSETLNFKRDEAGAFTDNFYGKTYTIPDGYKCTSLKMNAVFGDESSYLRILSRASDGDTILNFDSLYNGEKVFTDIHDDAKYLYIGANEGVVNTCTVNIEITYENASKLTDRVAALEASVGDIETALDNIIEIQNTLIGGEGV